MTASAPATSAPILVGRDGVTRGVRAANDDGLSAESEWRALIASFRPMLVQEARRLCRGHFDYDDLVQVAMMRAMNARTQLRDPSKLAPWLVRILTNAFLDENRRQRRTATVPLDSTHQVEAPGAEPSAWDGITDDQLRAAVDALPEDVRETFILFELQRCSYGEISRRLSVPSGTIGTRLRRARKQLLLILQPGTGVR